MTGDRTATSLIVASLVADRDAGERAGEAAGEIYRAAVAIADRDGVDDGLLLAALSTVTGFVLARAVPEGNIDGCVDELDKGVRSACEAMRQALRNRCAS